MAAGEDGVSRQRRAQRGQRRESLLAARGHHRPRAAVRLRAPLHPEPVRHLAVTHEHQQLLPHLQITLAQPDPVRLRRLQFQSCRQPLQQPPLVALHRVALHMLAPAPELHRPQQKRQLRRREHRVSRVERVLHVAELVRQAHLRLGPVTLLRAEQVRHPHIRPRPGHHAHRHALGTARRQLPHHRAFAHEDLFPPRAPGHPRRGLVRAHYATGAHSIQHRRGLPRRAVASPPEQVDQRTFSDLQPEGIPEQPAQPFQADCLRIVQVRCQNGDRLPERRATLQIRRRPRQDRHAALRAVGQPHFDHFVRVRIQAPPAPGTSLAIAPPPIGSIGYGGAGGRHGGILGSLLGRGGRHLLQLRDQGRQPCVLLQALPRVGAPLPEQLQLFGLGQPLEIRQRLHGTKTLHDPGVVFANVLHSGYISARNCFAPIRCYPTRALLVGMVVRKANRSVLEYQRSRGRPVPRSSGRNLIGVPGRDVLLAGVALGGLSRGPRRAGSRTRGNFRQSRLGPEPESATVELGSQVQVATLMEMGVNAALANADPTTGAYRLRIVPSERAARRL